MSLSPARPKGPHLNALRAFEAAARLGSFTAAAEELSVTPGAVTQHIKTLEAWAETQLFVRNARGVKLTPLAEELLPGFTQAFDQLGFSVHALRNKATPQKVKMAALPAIAQLWLAPRLGALREVAPEISVSVVAMDTPPNLVREPFDMTLFFSSDPIGKNEAKITGDRIFPVCAPSVAARLNDITDLPKETLLHDGAWGTDWDIWLKHQPDGGSVLQTGTTHSLYSIALEEARHGGGVLIAHEALVEKHLERGELVRPFAASVDLPRHMVANMAPTFHASETFQKIASILLPPQP
ncbi:LysR family transcriptional regulator [Halocynthiibacter styelae]|uniref:LysR family transcriptional regulator n=1 Tax=Halocynthiibacter styelae TaxID=2761955 RepID=A0A8J7IF43_9RHOB|nr:LysR family transcriptional regulator [Paenihalocynthiibacter styelae]MBI1494517.1 LysR family transcriptional regulator [Paenihalocynthiibacter styelae]